MRLVCFPVALALLGGGVLWLWRMAPELPLVFERAPWPLRAGIVGFVAGVVVFNFVHFSPVYILGHELTHWLVAKLFGRRTGALHLSWRGGSVEVERPNAAITLAPYCLPLFFVLSLGVVAFLNQWVPAAAGRHGQIVMAAWLGVCYAYHLVMTAYAMRLSQSDFLYCGWLLSMLFILGANVIVVDLLLCQIIHSPTGL